MEQQHEHIVRSYEEELSLLNNKIAKMGGLAEQVLGQSIDALERRDPQLAAATINEDEAIDALEREIEEQAVVMIARRQPMAYDLRQIMAALRISTDLERIGDLGKNIAKRAVAVVSEQQPKQLMLGLKHMGELALGQLKESLCIVIVTHSMQQAARVSQRTAFFHLGKLIEVDETVRIFTNPAEIQTQDYVTGRFG